MIWLELSTTYSSRSPVVTTTSIILYFNKHWLTQVYLEMAVKTEREAVRWKSEIKWPTSKQKQLKQNVRSNSGSSGKQTNMQLYTGSMPFLSPNQQCQSTEGKWIPVRHSGGPESGAGTREMPASWLSVIFLSIFTWDQCAHTADVKIVCMMLRWKESFFYYFLQLVFRFCYCCGHLKVSCECVVCVRLL